MQQNLDPVDPEHMSQVQELLLHYRPAIDRLEKMLAAGDPIAIGCMKEIACYVCDLCAHLGVDYDPAIGSLLLQHVATAMNAGGIEKWEEYTREIAPRCNANRLRGIQAATADPH